MNPGPYTVVRQRKRADCGITVLSSYLHIPYEDVYVKALLVSPRFAKHGLTIKHLIAIAALLKRTLAIKRRPSLEDDSGILGVTWKSGYGHWVVLLEGKILDGDPPQVWDAADYMQAYSGRPGWLVTEDK
jgi:hypothetical protein